MDRQLAIFAFGRDLGAVDGLVDLEDAVEITLVVLRQQEVALPLALGISADVFVVYYKITDSTAVAAAGGIAALGVLLTFWYGYPAWRARHAVFMT